MGCGTTCLHSPLSIWTFGVQQRIEKRRLILNKSNSTPPKYYVWIVVAGSDPSEINVRNAETVNKEASNLPTDDRHQGLSAAKAQGSNFKTTK